MKITRLICAVALTAVASMSAFAQEEKDYGSVSAGFETNTYYYFNDEGTGAVAPENPFGSNNYLKVDYNLKGFSAGIQLDAYLPAIMGQLPTQSNLFPNKFDYDGQMLYRLDWYAAFKDKGWDIKVGSLFEQYGSGLLFRTYEDRSLGVNNALQGIKAGYTFGDFLTISGLYGRVRSYPEIFGKVKFDVAGDNRGNTWADYNNQLTLGYTNNLVAGVDLVFSLSNALGTDLFDLSLEGSYIDKYESATEDELAYGAKVHTGGYSARLGFGIAGFTLKGEYMSRELDKSMYTATSLADKSEAIQVELGYSGDGFGGLLTFRKLSNPGFKGIRGEMDQNAMYINLNYVPALTQQHTYALATMNPYAPQLDEIGGQLDLYYNFKRGTVVGGKKGMKVHANFSTFYGENPWNRMEMARLFQDLTVDVERWWGKSVKMILFYSWQTINPAALGHGMEDIESHTVVADVTYKVNRKHSLRFELQHLYTEQDQKNWLAALVEYNIAPRWSISIQDQWNYGGSGKHYFNGSVSFSYSKVRAALNFGRFKAGYLCSGGVCRMTPAYTGANLSLVVTL